MRLRDFAGKVKRRTKRNLGRSWREHCRHLPVVADKVFLESYGGNVFTCSPEAIFRHLAQRNGPRRFTFVLVTNRPEDHKEQLAHLRDLAPFATVRRGSKQYYKHLYTSQYLVNNMSFSSEFVKREEQVYLNTWHGTPLKKMGFDVLGRAEDGKNIVRNFLAADYLLSASPAMTDRMYAGAFRLTNVFAGTILEEGTPRTDLQWFGDRGRAEVSRRFPSLNVATDDRRIVLYAPTWRGHDYGSPAAAADQVQDAVKAIESALDSRRYRVLVKPHQVVADQFVKETRRNIPLVPTDINANELLGITDVLVTDYSSIFFDFLATRRPIIHYVPDAAEYAKYRDIYENVRGLPGTVAETRGQLGKAVRGAVQSLEKGADPSSTYEDWRVRWAPLEDGHVTRRVVDTVFFGAAAVHAAAALSDGRTKLMIYAGPLNRNGITSSLTNLLANIDHEKYDVTALVPFSSTDTERIVRSNNLDPRVRVIYRFGGFTGSAGDNWFRDIRLRWGGVRLQPNNPRHMRVWQQEWRRIFGAAKFDHLIDFTGYSPFWGALFVAAGEGQRLIWQHNDLAADAHRSVGGRRKLYRGLNKVFQLYPWFDKIVSVSYPLMLINRSNLGNAQTSANFTWMQNSLDDADIDRKAVENAGQFARQDGQFTFVNVGRLSPEKNQSRLLKAFRLVHAQAPQSRLVLVGDGPLRRQLELEVISLGLSGLVDFAGMVSNPYPIMKAADCMVLSSDYEGQPMVILEAMHLGLPVISTAFGSIDGALPTHAGRVVEATPEALAEGMLSVLSEGVSESTFHARDYNSLVMTRFEVILSSTHPENSTSAVIAGGAVAKQSN